MVGNKFDLFIIKFVPINLIIILTHYIYYLVSYTLFKYCSK